VALLRKRRRDDAGRVFKHRAANAFLGSSLALTVAIVITALVSPRGNVVIGLVGLGELAVGVRAWMMGVYLRSNAIRVVNLYSTKTLPWAEVQEFEVAPFAQYRYGAYLVRTCNRGRIPILALTGDEWDPAETLKGPSTNSTRPSGCDARTPTACRD